jgi:hypothetical protein
MNLRTFRNWALLALIFGLFGFNNTDARADVAPLSHWNKANSALSTYTKRHFKTSPLPRPGIYLGGNYNPNTGVSVFKAQVKGVRRGTTRSHLYPLLPRHLPGGNVASEGQPERNEQHHHRRLAVLGKHFRYPQELQHLGVAPSHCRRAQGERSLEWLRDVTLCFVRDSGSTRCPAHAVSE